MTSFAIQTGLLMECGPSMFCVEASELGLAPGEWPGLLRADDARFGNGQPLRQVRPDEDGGRWYVQDLGSVWLHVMND